MEELHKKFIAKLITRYGEFNDANNKFESTSNSKIARDLFYSDSQFSRLINSTASEGEFNRALGNIQRLLDLDKLRNQGASPIKKTDKSLFIKRKKIFLTAVILFSAVALGSIYFFTSNTRKSNPVMNADTRYEMLKWGFENQFIQPYVKLKELPDDCDYPCYKYQGKWRLKNKYKIPFYRERNGFHYVAKEAVMYARCMDERDDSGESFEGYEYQKHEIWYDKREYPIDSFLTKGSNTEIRESYNLSDLSKNENFVKIAFVHTFFRTEFKIDSTLISRSGKALGRDIEFINDDILKSKLNDATSLIGLKDEIKAISANRLEDYSKPINCKPSLAPNTNFNLIAEGDEMSFNCYFSIGNFIVNYNKTYVFQDQYINNYCR
ncbi:hypothetical protein PI23P_01992 [Polaribacter irgensii 23-P]|uniref:Uncharacterized protein n=1 Tax=Polaribacter irgensii 23-P TaxID=313594 RepID=A4BW85_9FLAO|nr:hypothetical protein [Polaribacter irgensii]EAR13226.1 hypothetical protein PI23P_01992 [Polaribacter irgensii 23-P]